MIFPQHDDANFIELFTDEEFKMFLHRHHRGEYSVGGSACGGQGSGVTVRKQPVGVRIKRNKTGGEEADLLLGVI